MTIIEQARELLARESEWPIHSPILVAACRALIARDEALRELVAAEDALDADPAGGAVNRYEAAYRAAKRALADDGPPREG